MPRTIVDRSAPLSSRKDAAMTTHRHDPGRRPVGLELDSLDAAYRTRMPAASQHSEHGKRTRAR
jgi:hypothetical protein